MSAVVPRLGRRGVSSIEFAIAIPVVLLLLGALFDLSNLLVARIQLSNAVGNAASYALMSGSSVSTTTLASIVQKTGMLTGATAVVTGPACYCVTYNPTSLTAGTCGASCSNGTVAGSYVLITGSYTYTPILPQLSKIANTAVTETASVKVQ